MSELTHDSLSYLASKWLKRSYSANGPGCHIGLVEVGGLFGGERADAWGYRWGHGGGSVLVEVKVSRSDFLADAKKPHRNGDVLGMGTYRYYLCPEGVIQPDELPDGWGLLWVNKRGHVKPKAGHVLLLKSWKTKNELEPWQHQVNVKGEMELMAHLLARLGDPQELNQKYRTMQSEVNRLSCRVNELIKGRDHRAKRRHERALADQAEHTRQLIMEFANAIGQACEQIERGYPHCAANRLRQLHAEIMKESRNDGHH